MRLGAEYDRIHAAGGEVISISVDDDARQAGMFRRWPLPHTQFVSDPDGGRWLQALELFDPDERGGIALPGVLLIDPDGDEVYRHVGRDFADRTTDEELLDVLEALHLGAIDAPPGGPVGPSSDELDGFFRPDWFRPYFLGNRFASIAIGGRLPRGDPARLVAREHRLVSEASVAAWEQLTRG